MSGGQLVNDVSERVWRACQEHLVSRAAAAGSDPLCRESAYSRININELARLQRKMVEEHESGLKMAKHRRCPVQGSKRVLLDRLLFVLFELREHMVGHVQSLT